MIRRKFLFVISCMVLLITVLIQPSLSLGKTATNQGKSCREYQVPVTLSSTSTKKYKVSGTLCSQGPLKGKTVQVLIHGFTLSQVYWDFPYQPDRYSYVNALTKAGYATFSIDRIGVGKSDHPPAQAVTMNSNAYVVHQIVKQLRAGKIGDTSFSKVILVGHSLGSIISVIAAKSGGVNGLILTGMLHKMDPTAGISFFGGFKLAQLDPIFKKAHLPLGYVSVQNPGRRAVFNYDTDPKVIALDDKLRATGTFGELLTSGQYLLPSLTKAIHVPILLVVGEKDRMLCAKSLSCANGSAIVQRERDYFSNKASLEGYIVKNSGHNINYERHAPDFFQVARKWSDRRIRTVHTPLTD